MSVEASGRLLTVSDLRQRFLAEHTSKKRPRTQVRAPRHDREFVLPAIGTKKVAEIAFTDIRCASPQDHRARHSYPCQLAPYRSCTSIFALAVRWRMRPDNPGNGG